MALSIKNRETEGLARKLAQMQRKPITLAVHDALAKEVKLESELNRLTRKDDLLAKIREIQDRVAEMPTFNDQNMDDWLYDENGIPH